jgi:hypothetical protein
MLLFFSFFIGDFFLYDQILLPRFLLSLLTRNRAELNTITSERTNEKLIEKMDEEKEGENARTDVIMA